MIKSIRYLFLIACVFVLGMGFSTVQARSTVFPTLFSEVQVNYIYPTEQDIEFSQVLVNLQINF